MTTKHKPLTPAQERERDALIEAFERWVRDGGPRLLATPKHFRNVRIKPHLTPNEHHALKLCGYIYALAAGRPVSQSLLVGRAIALLANRVEEMARDERVMKAEAEAILATREEHSRQPIACPEVVLKGDAREH